MVAKRKLLFKNNFSSSLGEKAGERERKRGKRERERKERDREREKREREIYHIIRWPKGRISMREEIVS